MKKALALLLTICMLGALGGCSKQSDNGNEKSVEGNAEGNTGETTEEKQEEHEEVTLYVYMQDIDAIDAWNELLANFMEEYPWITCELMDSQEKYYTTVLATGDMPDIANLSLSSEARAMVDAGLIADTSKTEVCQHVSQDYLDSVTYEGVCIGVPQGVAFSVMFYNMKILQEAGWDKVPSNRDEFLQCCKDVKAKGYDALTLAGDKTTCCWMLWECILATEAGAAYGSTSAFDEAFKDGTLEFAGYPEATRLLDEVSAYIMPGTTAYTEDDVASAMASGNVAMCIAGNWSAGNICGAIETVTGDAAYVGASLPPFQKEGEASWTTVAPESSLVMSGVDQGEAHNEARLQLYEYIWEPENYKLLQNARGIVPVIDNMTSDQIVLDAAIAALVDEVPSAPSISMGFNCWTAEFRSIACTALNDVYAGNSTAEAAVNTMQTTLQQSYLNMEE